MPGKIYQLIYSSKMVDGLTPGDIEQILLQSQKSNKLNKVTGVLIARGGNFLQLLEGDIHRVHLTFAKIRNDKRHTDVNLLIEHEVDGRLFSNWNMLYDDLKKAEPVFVESVLEVFNDKNVKPTKILDAMWKFYGAWV